jgi:peroxin-5
LGISCTNILDEMKAMNYLKKWIILNPKYKHLNVDPNVIPDQEADVYAYRMDDLRLANERMVAIFENASLNSPNDPELFVLASLFRTP